jgi:hypothetical protein
MNIRCTIPGLLSCAILMTIASNRVMAIEAYVPLNGLVAVEAEDLQPGTLWEKQTTPTGFSGTGWMKYTGPDRYDAGKLNNDTYCKYQGEPSEWLKIPVLIQEPGRWCMQIRCYHTVSTIPTTGDATVWTHVWGYENPFDAGRAWNGKDPAMTSEQHQAWIADGYSRMVWMSHGETNRGANKFEWLGWGPSIWFTEGSTTHTLCNAYFDFTQAQVPCVAVFYVTGRSAGFGADRIHLFTVTGDPAVLKDAAYPPNYKSITIPLTSLSQVDAPLLGNVPYTGATSISRLPGANFGIPPGSSNSTTPLLFDLRGRMAPFSGQRAAGPKVRVSNGLHGMITTEALYR